jgi:cytolysin-activating lysine-acyltransferase
MSVMSLAAAKEDAVDTSALRSQGNGAAGPPPPPATAVQAAPRTAIRPRDARQARFAQSFAQIVAVLMRDPGFRSLRLADLEWLVLPPVMAGQFSLAQAPSPLGRVKGKEGGQEAGQEAGREGGKEGGVLVPVAVALWARVSDAVDKALSESLDQPVRLRPADWAAGDNIWLMAVAGDQRAVPKFLEQLAHTEFKGRRVKMRVRGPDNAVVVKTLGPSS